MNHRPRWPSCPYCGCQFSKRSMGIHKKQCIKKMEMKIDTLPPELRNRILNRNSQAPKRRRGKRGKSSKQNMSSKHSHSRGRVGNSGVDTNKWLRDSNPTSDEPLNLIRCKFCTRSFFIDRIQKHESVCAERNKKRKKFNSLKQRIHEEVSMRHVIVEKRKAKKLSNKRKTGMYLRAPKKNDWREQHREFIRNIREAKKWERSKRLEKQQYGDRYRGTRFAGMKGGSGYGGGGGIQVLTSSKARGGGSSSFSGGISGKMNRNDLSRYSSNRGNNDLSRYRTGRGTGNYGQSSSTGFRGHRTSQYSKKSRLDPPRKSNIRNSRKTKSSVSRNTKYRPKTSGTKFRRNNVKKKTPIERHILRQDESNPLSQSFDDRMLVQPKKKKIVTRTRRRIGKRKKISNNKTTGEVDLRTSMTAFGSFIADNQSSMYRTSSSSIGSHYDNRRKNNIKKKISRKKTGSNRSSTNRPNSSSSFRRNMY